MGQLTYEERKQLKQERREAARKTARSKSLFKLLFLTGTAFAVIAAIVILIVISITSRAPRVGEFVPSQGAEHVKLSEPAPYAHLTNPPTSGWHYSTPLPSDFYKEEQADGYLIHSMEHGGVILWYKPDITEAEKQQLSELFKDFSKFKFIVAPRTDMPSRYAMTAWEYLDRFDEFDRARIEAFIHGNVNRGPEVAPM